MSRKEFRKNPALSFISNANKKEEQKEEKNVAEKLLEVGREKAEDLNEELKKDVDLSSQEEETNVKVKIMIKTEVPKGIKNNPEYIETKSKRVQLLMQPSTVEGIKKIAKKKKTSMNDLINFIVKDFVKNFGEW